MSNDSKLSRVEVRLREAAAVSLVASVLAACGGGSADEPAPVVDNTAPTLRASVPAAGASAVASGTVVSIMFSEAIDPSTVTAASVTLQAAGVGVPVSAAVAGSTVTLTPSAPLAAATSFAVTVSTAVRDLAGNALASAGSWSFATGAVAVAAAWSEPVVLDTGDGAAFEPAVAATMEDVQTGVTQAAVVWKQHDGTQNSIHVSRYALGSWTMAQLVEDRTAVGRSSAGGASTPRVTMGAYGRTLATWLYDDGNSGYSIWGNEAGSSSLASSARQLSPGGSISGLAMAIDGRGHNVFTVWSQHDAARAPASYRTAQMQYLYVPCEFLLPCVWSPDDFGWRSSTLVETAPWDAFEPRVAAHGQDGAVAVWNKSDGTAGVELWANTHSRAGGWATPVRVDAGSNRMPSESSLASSAADNAVVAWIESVAGRQTVFASRLDNSGWSTPIVFNDVSVGRASSPRVAMDAAGNAIVVWLQDTPGARRVTARRCPPAGLAGCSAPVPVGSLAGFADRPRLAMTPAGDAVVVWQQGELRAAWFSAASGLWDATPALIAAQASGAEVALDRHGRATVAWSAFDAAGKSNIYASRRE